MANYRRTLVIGDIHGGLKALKQLLDKAKVNHNDLLIFLGDYVDGWSDSAEVISFLIELKADYQCRFIRGNHDALVNNWLKTGDANDKWMEHGGQSTKDAYRNIDKSTRELHIQFMDNLENYIIDSQNRLFLHAGFANLHGPDYEFHKHMVYWDRTLWEMVKCMDSNLSTEDEFYPDRLKLFKEIYIGHTPTTRIGENKPVNFQNVWNIDTGAAFKGSLSMMDIETKEVWQSDPVYKLYPDEDGRN
ncbi:metallophosphoesterase family protein [Psychroflexus planctonicus]|uniref:Metallophosphatase n=1 Tax=Psychroflexus planctonicus TaxID=1526575 RepID=A0ABQ1SF44_9FLAO|nr:metallophosphoesterase family protein [Psychroflexus planctonicus]GGE34457.1 metallophosphatase [Psychroflexus planctonicus]